MIECPVCHKKMSEFVTECPNCHAIITKEQGRVSAVEGKDTEEIVTKMNKPKFIPLIANIIITSVLIFLITGITGVSPNVNALIFRIIGYTILIVGSYINIKANNIRLPKKTVSIIISVISVIAFSLYFICVRTYWFGRGAIIVFQYYPFMAKVFFVVEVVLHAAIIDIIILEVFSAIGLIKK